MRKIGETLKALRKDRGLSQSQLANIVGVTQGAIYFWENDINEPSVSYAVALAGFFGVSVEDLVGDDNLMVKNYDDKAGELFAIYGKLNSKQREILVTMAKEMIGK